MSDSSVPPAPHTPKRRRDIGSKVSLRIATVVAVLASAAIIFLQVGMPIVEANTPEAPGADAERLENTLTADTLSQPAFDLQITVKLAGLLRSLQPNGEDGTPGPGEAGLGTGLGGPDTFVDQLDKASRQDDPLYDVRVAALAGYLVSDAQESIDRLQEQRAVLGNLADGLGVAIEDRALIRDIDVFLRVYRDGPDALEQDETDELIRRHGLVARAAIAQTAPGSDDRRDAVAKGAWMIMLGGGLFAVLVVVALITAFVVGIVVMVRTLNRGRGPATRFVPPIPGGSVSAEVFALFAAAFLTINLAFDGLALTQAVGAETLVWMRLASYWLLLGVLLWPWLRGDTLRDGLRDMGFGASVGPRGITGFFSEVGFGVLGYLCCVPLFLIGGAISIGLSGLIGRYFAPDGGAPNNPLIDLLTSGSWPLIVMVALLATVWAPICEEAVFRGSLFRAIRSRAGLAITTLVTATVFALFHGYGLLFIFPLIGLAIGFAVMREMRGSIVPCITAHFCHNAIMVTISALVFTGAGA